MFANSHGRLTQQSESESDDSSDQKERSPAKTPKVRFSINRKKSRIVNNKKKQVVVHKIDETFESQLDDLVVY